MAAEYLTIQEAARQVRCNPWTIWRLCRLGIVPSIRVGTRPNSGPYRIAVAD